MQLQPATARSRRTRAFTMIEVTVSAMLAAIVISGILIGYTETAKRAEWSAYSLAGQSLAIQGIEQVRAAKWDTESEIDEIVATNFPVRVHIMDLPVAGTNATRGTNFTIIKTINAAPPLLKMIRVDCVWRAPNGRLHTNSAATYRAPNN